MRLAEPSGADDHGPGVGEASVGEAFAEDRRDVVLGRRQLSAAGEQPGDPVDPVDVSRAVG